jgi:hypothetical protein
MRALALLLALLAIGGCATKEASRSEPLASDDGSVDICLIAAGPLARHNAVARAQCWADEMTGKVSKDDPAHALVVAHARERMDLAEAYGAGRLTVEAYGLALNRAEALFLLNLSGLPRRNAP